MECRKSDILNCWIFDFTENKCRLCIKGFILNKDGVCDKSELYQCAREGYIKNLS